MNAFVNPARDPARVPTADGADAMAFHRSLPGYAPTPVRELTDLAAELGVGAVLVKDESNRFGLPAFKVLGASWAIERTLRTEPGIHTLVAASAGNHGRAVAHVAATRGLACRVFLPSRSARARREAIASEGAEVVVVDGTYEEAVIAAHSAAAEPGAAEIADVGDSPQAAWVIDGYATLFAEAAEQADFDLLVVPVGVGSLAAAAARFAAPETFSSSVWSPRPRRASQPRLQRALRPPCPRPAPRWPGSTAPRSPRPPGRRSRRGWPERSPSPTPTCTQR